MVDWKQRKLGDHSQILTGGTPKTQIKEYWEPKEIPWMSSGEINKKRLFSTDNQISKLGFENSSARWIKENSVLIALAGQGKTRGTVAINEISLTSNQSIAAIEPDDTLDSGFLFQNLGKRYEELRLASSGDGSRGGLNKQIISDIKIIAPSIKEQNTVGSFFKHLDDTIALHQRKLASLKQLKQSYLQLLFPQNKGNNPTLRFCAFSDSWEQRKLGELLSEVRRPIKMNDDEYYELVTVKRRNEGIVSRGIFQGKDVLVKSQFQIKTGDYLISKRQVVHGANGIVPRNLNNAIVSNEYLVSIGNKNVTTDFLTIISRRPDMYKKFFLSSYGIDIEKLVFNVEDWKKRTIQIPSVSEQNQISIFFKQLDNTIDLHQCQLEKILELKNVLLGKMFL